MLSAASRPGAEAPQALAGGNRGGADAVEGPHAVESAHGRRDCVPSSGVHGVLVFDDPTPNTVILKRIVEFPMGVAAKCTGLKGEEMNDFIVLILLIAPKMLSVYKHKEAYHTEERCLEETFEADPATPRVHSQELFEEFDVFVVQIKSTLDHMVKIMPADARAEVDDVHRQLRCGESTTTNRRNAPGRPSLLGACGAFRLDSAP